MAVHKLLHVCRRLCAHICIGLILAIRPLLGPASCRHTVGCTAYAIHQLKTQPLHRAIWCIVKRVVACNPISAFLK